MAKNRAIKPHKRGLGTAVALAVLIVVGGVMLIRDSPGVRAALGIGIDTAQESTSSVAGHGTGLAMLNRIFGQGAGDHRSDSTGLEVEPNATVIDQRTMALASKGAVVGTPRVLSDNRIQLAGKTIVLWGVVIPPRDYACTNGGRHWFCGGEATAMLAKLTAGHPLACFPKYQTISGAEASRCYVGYVDIAARLVKAGWAVEDPSVTSAYRFNQASAQLYHRGLWQGGNDPRNLVGQG